MKNIKRIMLSVLSVICCIAMVLCLAACDGDKEENKGGNKTGGTNDSIFYITYNNVKISLGADAASIIEALGEPKSRQEVGDCGGLGAQIRYVYADINVYTLVSDGKEKIDGISILNDLVSTPKGVCLGSTQSDVKNAYGDPDEITDDAVIYIEGNYNLKITFANNVVSAIDYLRVTG